MGYAECCAAPSMRVIVGEGDDALCLLACLDHGNHDAMGAHVDSARHEMILARRHANEWRHAYAATAGELRLHCLKASSGMLHVVENEIRASCCDNSGQACEKNSITMGPNALPSFRSLSLRLAVIEVLPFMLVGSCYLAFCFAPKARTAFRAINGAERVSKSLKCAVPRWNLKASALS